MSRPLSHGIFCLDPRGVVEGWDLEGETESDTGFGVLESTVRGSECVDLRVSRTHPRLTSCPGGLEEEEVSEKVRKD